MKLGFHINKNGKKMNQAFAAHFAQTKDIKSDAAQIFVCGPQSSKETLDGDEKKKLLEWSKKKTIVIHGAYIDNGWDHKSIPCIQREMEIAAEIGAIGVIIHLSKKTTENIAILKKLNPPKGVRLILEINAAKVSKDTFETPEKLGALFKLVDKLGLTYEVGLCVDTAHLSSIGVNLQGYNEAKQWIAATMIAIGGGHEIMFHLNDSKSLSGSGVDRHEVLYSGVIWGEKQVTKKCGVDAVLEFANEHGSVVILERSEIEGDLDILKHHKLTQL